MKKLPIIILIIGLSIYFLLKNTKISRIETIPITPTPTQTIVPTPTVKPLTMGDMDNMYGPCVKVGVLMYHHVGDKKIAKKDNWQYLNVEPEIFRKQLEFIKTNSYSVISFENLINFFDNNTPLPPKPVIITFDDAYEDNYINAFPLLKEFGYKASIFVPTGLIQNPEYLNWQEVKEMADSGLIYFGNHTWSHHDSASSPQVLEKEIGLANRQLKEYGQNGLNVFAYPYGKPSNEAKKVLADLNYKLAFTTVSGNVLCKGKRLELPRIRAKNEPKLNLGL